MSSMFDDEGPLFEDSDEQEQYLPSPAHEAAYQAEESVTLDYIPAFQAFPVMQEEQLVYVLLMLRTASLNQEANRVPLNVCLVLDQSSSMRGEKLYAIKTAARHVVDQLTVADYFSLISFKIGRA